jgi:hypothetical protein
MKRLFVSLIIFLLFSFCISTVHIKVAADVGNFNMYDDSSDDSFDFDFDWGSSSSSSSSSSGSSDSSSFIFDDSPTVTLIIIIALVLFYVYSKKKGPNKVPSGNRPAFTPRSSQPPSVSPQASMEIEAKIRENDPDFSAQKFLSWAEEVFITLQEAWTKRDWRIIRPFECEALFNKHSKQLDEYIRNNTINVVERVCVDKSALSDYSTDNRYEYLTVYLKARMHDYIIDATTNEVVKGDKNRVFNSGYYLKFMRSLGVKTTFNSGKNTTNCPNCGAPTQITSAGECEYCNSVITTGEHDWVLCDLDSTQ